MNEDFRKRFLLPFVLPVVLLGSIVGFAVLLSRVLLAVPELVAVALALGVAGYVMGVAAMVQNRPRITSRALGVTLALGLVGVVVAGGLSAAAGTRSFEEESEGGEGEAAAESAEGGGSGEGSGEGGSGGIPSGAKVFTAQELEFTATPDSLSAGEATIALDNQAGVVHNVAFEGVDGGEPIVEAEGSETATGEVEVESGELTYFCSVPGHREAGMEGTLTVE